MLISKIAAENAALLRCREFCSGRRIGLYLETLSAEFQFDRKKLTIYVQKSGEVSVCKLVRKLYDAFKMRISVEEVISMNVLKDNIAQYLKLSKLDVPFDEAFNYQPLPNTYCPTQLDIIDKMPQKNQGNGSRHGSRQTTNSSHSKKPSKIHHQNPSLLSALHDYMPPTNYPIDDIYRKHDTSKHPVRQNPISHSLSKRQYPINHEYCYAPYINYDEHAPIAPALPLRLDRYSATQPPRAPDNQFPSYRHDERFSSLSGLVLNHQPLISAPHEHFSLLSISTDGNKYGDRHPANYPPSLVHNSYQSKFHNYYSPENDNFRLGINVADPSIRQPSPSIEWCPDPRPSPFPAFESDFLVSPSLSSSSSPTPPFGPPISSSSLF